eukprot:4201555-Lingulodinium_polyedra.AAC.1
MPCLAGSAHPCRAHGGFLHDSALDGLRGPSRQLRHVPKGDAGTCPARPRPPEEACRRRGAPRAAAP